jgi:hypothetical protein
MGATHQVVSWPTLLVFRAGWSMLVDILRIFADGLKADALFCCCRLIMV